MASRMDRYYKDELITSGRSSKNKSLYEQIENLENYTNIEEYIMIGDRYDADILGAESVGIKGILLSLSKKDCLTISSLKELKNIL